MIFYLWIYKNTLHNTNIHTPHHSSFITHRHTTNDTHPHRHPLSRSTLLLFSIVHHLQLVWLLEMDPTIQIQPTASARLLSTSRTHSTVYSGCYRQLAIGFTLLSLLVVSVTTTMSGSKSLLSRFCGYCAASLLSIMSLCVDYMHSTYRHKACNPKLIDCALLFLWVTFVVCLIFQTSMSISIVYLYSGVIIQGSLCVISLISLVIGKPWIYQYAIEVAPEESWKILPEQTEPTLAQLRFTFICHWLTKFWGCLFLFMSVGTWCNVQWNTTFDGETKTLKHNNVWLNVTFGICWPIILSIYGKVKGVEMAKARANSQYTEL